MALRKTHQQFVEQSNKIHNNKYQYNDVYAGDAIKIDITCNKHGNFKQIPSSHLQGNGCPKCATEYTSQLFKKDNKSFLDQALAIHKNKYFYLEDYKGAKTKIKIECTIHGIFNQSPDKHLQGNGCPKCAGKMRKTKEQFVNEANIVHKNMYTYPGEYVNARTNIEIECIKHGIFLQVPDVHLNGCGCPGCSTNVSKGEAKWLDSLNIPNDNRHRSVRLKIGQSYIKPDGFDPETNTIYEFYGDYFHGNMNIFDPQQINHKNGKTMEELYSAIIAREKLIKGAGYNLVSIWEKDWKESLKSK